MDKRRLHHTWTRFRLIKPWYFLIAAVVCLGIAAYGLRQNYKHMVALRDAVFTADKDNGNVELALENLRSYVNHHMNTNLASGPNAVHPPIQLKYTYQRLSVAQGSSSDASQVYPDAQKYCEATIPNGFSGSYRLNCIKTYVAQHQAASDPTAKAAVPKNLYEFDFTSPWWSPDLAGWSLAAAALFVVCFVITFVSQALMERAVR